MFHYNTSASIPEGWYVKQTADTLTRGDILRLCLPASVGRAAVRKGYVHRGSCPGGSRRVGKPVAAIGGDTVRVLTDSIQINRGPPIRAEIQLRDRRGRRMDRVTGRIVLQQNECFLLSTESPFSYDSRYFGPVACHGPYQILRRAR
ncbi:MAG: S26 family signal peptidase [Bacteroidota bacterium]|nr:S26 family signal peptidase [Bacteroidota bacterium]